MNRRLPRARLSGPTIWFVGLWLMLWADVSVANVLTGLVLALGVVLITRRIATRTDDDTIRLSPVGVIVFAGHVVWQLVKSNLRLAWEIVTPRNTIATGTVDVPLRSASPIVAMAVSNVVTLTPGTATIDMSEVPPTLTIGVLHLHDPDRIRRAVIRTEALAIRAFGTVGARAALRKEAP